MMWFWLTLLAMLGWGVEDVFLKFGAERDDADAQYKIAAWLGAIMGLSLLLLFPLSESGLPLCRLVADNKFFLLVPLAYAATMVLSNVGLRYLEMSIMSPVENASGAFPMVIMIVYFLATGKISSIGDELSLLDLSGTVCIIGGMIALAVVQRDLFHRGKEIRNENTRYRFGALALLFPLIFCFGDTLDTVVGGIMLGEDSIGEIDLFRLYCLMFFVVGVASYLILVIRRKKIYHLFAVREMPKMAAGVCETLAYVSYIYALAARPLLVAPLVSAYCIISILLSRVFLKEKLRVSQYLCIAVIVAGIVVLGISEGLEA